MKAKRITYLDMAKGIGIILVVIGHSQLVTGDIYNAIASFHMPLFFVISGMLMQHTGEEKRNGRDIVLRKLKTLMLPYAVFSISYFIVYGTYHFMHPEVVDLVFLEKMLIHCLSFYGISVLWFLPTLFCGELFFLTLRKKANHKITILTVLLMGCAAIAVAPVFQEKFWFNSMPLLIFSFVLMLVVRSVIVCIFLCLGYYVKMFLKEHERISIPELLFGIAGLSATIIIGVVNGTADLHFMVFCNVFLYFPCACLGSVALILICKNIKQSKILIFFGLNSLIIMATHMDWMLLKNAQSMSLWVNQFITRAKDYFFWLGIIILMVIFETVIIFIVNQYLYFLIGKKKPEQRTLNPFRYIKWQWQEIAGKTVKKTVEKTAEKTEK